MFVLEALLLTFMTTPLVTTLYPPHLRVRVAATGANFNNVADDEAGAKGPGRRKHEMGLGRGRSGSDYSSQTEETGIGRMRTRFAVVLDKLDHLPGVMAVTQLVQPPPLVPPPPPPSSHGLGGTSPKEGRRTSRGSAVSGNGSGEGAESPSAPASPTRLAASRQHPNSIHISALRLLELTDRHSAVMKSSASATLLYTDPVLAIYRTFVALLGLHQGQAYTDTNLKPKKGIVPDAPEGGDAAEKDTGDDDDDDDAHVRSARGGGGVVVSSALEIVTNDDMAWSVREWATREAAEMVVIPWALHGVFGSNHGASSGNGSGMATRNGSTEGPLGELGSQGGSGGAPTRVTMNPFEALFGSGGRASSTERIGGGGGQTSSAHSAFVRGVFSQAGKERDIALFVDMSGFEGGHGGPMFNMGVGGGGPTRQHIFLPFFGGPDDRLALEFVVQLCMNSNIRATVVRMVKTDRANAVVGAGVATGSAVNTGGMQVQLPPPSPALLHAHRLPGGDGERPVEEANMLTVASVRRFLFHLVIPY